MKNHALVTLAAFIMSAGIALAQAEPEGVQLARLGFASVDHDGKGYVHMGDMEVFRESVFISMDADENEQLSLDEFLNWDFGFVALAKENDAEVAYRTALKVVFGLWDRDANGGLTEAEHRYAIDVDFERADLNGDEILSEGEFLRAFSIMVALRSALKPEE